MNISLPKILITGGQGQVAQALQHHPAGKNFYLKFYSHQQLDIANFEEVERVIKNFKPDIIINTAAYTKVDQAEVDQKIAWRVNTLGPQKLAQAAKATPIIHLSTDYVFSGAQKNPYVERDATSPLNYYGDTKLGGEFALQEYGQHFVIVRLSGVFSEYGHNFVKSILKAARVKETLKVVNDQITAPTEASDIAAALYQISYGLLSQAAPNEIYHYCSADPVSWYEFSDAILKAMRKDASFAFKNLESISAYDYPTQAKRPIYSVLNCEKIQKKFGILQPSWQIAIKRVLKKLEHYE